MHTFFTSLPAVLNGELVHGADVGVGPARGGGVLGGGGVADVAAGAVGLDDAVVVLLEAVDRGVIRRLVGGLGVRGGHLGGVEPLHQSGLV